MLDLDLGVDQGSLFKKFMKRETIALLAKLNQKFRKRLS